ncbi:PLDc N-terminal domain-containing protein [Streptomyces violens]|uniref:PLDc N-terminal domain-containing protein n=1 Tax=Streptomyces violens TaxID=66377 RepID=UPI00068A75B0|nr:PLDc N-terminal domain-containing protein [Streptomyces violens]
MNGSVSLAYDYPILGVFWTMFLLFLWVMWFVLLFHVIADVFRDDRLNGWAKAGWIVFVLVLPFLGVLVYVAVRGRGMGRRKMTEAEAQRDAFDAYIRRTAASDPASTTRPMR